MYRKPQRIHFVGIGGIGMSGIAELLLRNGYAVSGSDRGANDATRALAALGATILEGHAPEHVQSADLVVRSSAITEDNPEIVAAHAQEIPVIPRAEMLAELMRLKHGIAVAGSHGKTTTTSMIATGLVAAGLDPTVVVGGRMDNFGGTNARLGAGEYIVVEADESDGSFNKLTPAIAIATNLDREHLEHYGTMAQLKRAFLSFLEKVPFYGLAVVCGDDPLLRAMAPKLTRRHRKYGFRPDNDLVLLSYVPEGEGSVSRLRVDGDTYDLRLRVPGRHNALNAVAAIAVANELAVPIPTMLEALSTFRGVQRRFQVRGEKNGVTFVDDYAHHPSEIRATLSAARDRFPHARLRVVFQPHRYSRVEDLFDDFVTAFSAADSVSVLDVYAAGEPPRPGLDRASIAAAMCERGSVHAVEATSPRAALDRFIEESSAGDVVLTLGAGDLPNVYRELF